MIGFVCSCQDILIIQSLRRGDRKHGCRVELHTQKADQAEIPESERRRSDSLRQALRKFFLSPANSTWVLAARLFPFLVPIIRIFAKYFPDKLLVSFLLSVIE